MIYLTGHGDHNSGDGEEGGGNEAEVFHLEKGCWVRVGLEEKRGVGPTERWDRFSLGLGFSTQTMLSH